MSVLRFVLSLVAVVVVHALGTRLWGDFAIYVDLFLVLTVVWAFEATTLTGLAAGLVAGLAADAFSGGLYGLNGFANTVVGYLTAFSVARLAKMNASGAAMVGALAAVVQQFTLLALVYMMVPNPAPPTIVPIAWKIVITAGVGASLFIARGRLIKLTGRLRRAREAKIRF